MIAAILIGRKGSEGFPGKNTKPIMGRMLSEYPLLAAKNSKFIDKVFVSTDDPKIMEVGRHYDADIIERPPELATKEALGEDAFQHAQQVIKERCLSTGETLELTVLLMCNSPTILAGTLDEGISVLRDNPEYDSAVTVSCYNMWAPLRARQIATDGLLHPFVPFEKIYGDTTVLSCDRDSGGDAWFADMGASIIRPECLDNLEYGILPQKWMGRKIFPLKQWGGADVDFEWQFPQVEFWLKAHGFTESDTPYGEQ